VLEEATGAMAQVLAPGAARLARISIGRAVSAGATVLTGAQGRAALRLASGASLRMNLGTRVRLVSARVLALEKGAIYLDNVTAKGERAPMEVRTPFGVARDLGTQFEVRLTEGSLRVRVREGAVVLSQGDRREAAEAGGELVVDSTGAFTRGTVATYGTEWDWVVGLAPAFVIEGSRLGDFLSWVSRETGWALQFPSEEVAQSLSAVVLHGSIGGLEPEEALSAVLPTCGLTHRVGAGRLEIAPSEVGEPGS
jgi:ferric-dicitrate binding protein FerR (iron transport regulator)